MRIFVSYASEYAGIAERLSISLVQEGHDVFFDRTKLPEGDAYHERIREAIRRSHLFIYLVSPKAVEEGSYAISELEVFRTKHPNPSRRVLPVIVAPTRIDQIPNYARAVTFQSTSGDLVADVTARVAEIAAARRKRLLLSAAVIVGVVALAMLAAFFYRREPAPKWTTAARSITVYAQPDQDSRMEGVVAAGHDFTVTPVRGNANWARVVATDGTAGWVMVQDLSTVTDIQLARGFGYRGGFWQLFFTAPTPPGQVGTGYGIDARLADAIARAQRRLDIAIYDMNNRLVTNAILEAHRRGVEVRVYTDDERTFDPHKTFGELRSEGISVRRDSSSQRIMLDRFIVIDGKTVWVGSWNYTENATYRNNESVVVLESPEIASVFTEKFEHLFNSEQLPAGAAAARSPGIGPGGKPLPYGVKVYFAPEDSISRMLRDLSGNARQSITFMTFVFSRDELREAFEAAARRGVKVRGIIEARLAGSPIATRLLEARGNVDVRMDGNPRFLHHNCLVIDRRIVVMGSFNLSQRGLQMNDGAVVVVPDPALAAKFEDEFARLWKSARQYVPAPLGDTAPEPEPGAQAASLPAAAATVALRRLPARSALRR